VLSFASIPTNILEPLVAVEFDSSKAQSGPQLQPYKGLIVGQRLSAGSEPLASGLTCTAPKLVTSAEQASALFGSGSVAHRMARAWLNQNRVTELWVVGVADAGSPTAAAFTITVTVTTAVAGTVFLYVCGELLQIGVAAAQTQNSIAAAINTAINSAVGLPITSTVLNNVVTCTARNAGTCGNSIDIRTNYQAGDVLPGGVTVAIAQSVTGATDPTIADVLAVIGDTWFNRFAFGWRNSTTLSAIDTELEARWGPLRPIDGRAFFGMRDTHANAVTAGSALNSKHTLIVPRYKPASAEWEYAAALAAATALSAQQDPARPHQTTPLVGIAGPQPIDDFDFTERNILLDNGLTTVYLDGGVERIGRAVTTYQRAPSGADDTSYLDLTTLDTLSLLRYSIRNRLLLKYPKHKLARDGTRYDAGQAIVTPAAIRGEVLSWFRELEGQGLVEDFEQFKRDLIVEIDATNPNRVNILVPSNLINGLIVRAIKLEFRL
jgi:phage tail sheath gpL-like